MARGTLEPLLSHVRRFAGGDSGEPSDRQCLDRFRSTGDPAAFAVIVRRHGRLVHAACRAVLTEEADIEDAFQATFLVLLQRAGEVHWRPSLGGWLYGVAHRVAMAAQRRAALRCRHERAAAGERRGVNPPGSHSSSDPTWREACAILHEELDRLPDRFRLPLVLCYLHGLSRDEAAAQLGWSTGSVKGRLERGRERLKRRLVRRGIDLSAGLLAAVAGEANAMVPDTLAMTAVEMAVGVPSAAVAGLVKAASRTIIGAQVALASGLAVVAGLFIAVAAVGRTPVAPDGPAAKPQGDLLTAETVTVHGRVLGPDGKPVGGARLQPTSDLFGREIPGGFPAITTDADGRFRCVLPPAIAERGLLLVAQADGLGLAWERIRPGRPDVDVEFQLTADETPIRGRILDLQGRPLPGVAVAVHAITNVPAGDMAGFLAHLRHTPNEAYVHDRKFFWVPRGVSLRPPIRTDADGRFELRGIGRDRLVTLRLSGPAVAESLVTVVNRPGVDLSGATSVLGGRHVGPVFELAVAPDRPVVGTVRTKDGTPVAGAVVLGMVDRTGVEIRATTDAAGRYRLAGLGKGGGRTIRVEPPAGRGLVWAARQVPDAPGLEPARADFELADGVIVRGQVRDKTDGRPVPTYLYYWPLPENRNLGEFPELPGRTDAWALYSWPTDSDGRFEVTVPPGAGILTAELTFDVRTGWHRYLPARASEADRKRLTFSHSGDLESVETAFGPRQFSTNGAYAVVDAALGAAPLNCSMEFDPGRSQVVKVVDPDRRPVAGTIAQGVTNIWFPEPTRLEAAEVMVPALDPAKPRRVTVRHLERKLVGNAMLPTADGKPVTIRLQLWGGATGRVVDENGKPRAWARVRLLYTDDSNIQLNVESFEFLPGPVTTDAEGRFRVEGLMPGRTVQLMEPLSAKQPRWTVKSGEIEDLGTVTAVKIVSQPVP